MIYLLKQSFWLWCEEHNRLEKERKHKTTKMVTTGRACVREIKQWDMTRAWLARFNHEKEPESRNILGHKTEFGNGSVWDMSETVSMITADL